jgi:hypothetical protein
MKFLLNFKQMSNRAMKEFKLILLQFEYLEIELIEFSNTQKIELKLLKV